MDLMASVESVTSYLTYIRKERKCFFFLKSSATDLFQLTGTTHTADNTLARASRSANT